MSEIWEPINSTNGLYEASNYGRIRSVKRFTTSGVILKQYHNPRNGYMYVSICINNVAKTRRVHRLVAEAFLGESNLQVNHKDGDKTNNMIDNLEYCTQSQNMKHAFATGLEKVAGVPVIDLETKVVYATLSDAALSLGGNRGEMVARVCKGDRSHYRGKHFAFLHDYENGTIPPYKGKHRKAVSKSLWR